MWVLVLPTIHTTSSQSGTGPALRPTVEPAPACFSPKYAHSRDHPKVTFSDCLRQLAANLMDPIVKEVRQWPSAYTRKGIREQGGCNIGVITSSRVTSSEARFSLLDQTVAAAITIRQCVERGPWGFGGITYVQRSGAQPSEHDEQPHIACRSIVNIEIHVGQLPYFRHLRILLPHPSLIYQVS